MTEREDEVVEVVKVVEKSLLAYRCQYQEYDDGGGGMQLLDVFSPPNAADVSLGRQEIELLADHIGWAVVDTIAAPKAKCEKAERDFQVELEMRKHSEALLAETQKERDKALDSYLAAEAKCVELERALHASVEVIKGWHNADEVWPIYFAHAPEMKLIRAALLQPSDTKRDG